ncbi:MAG TPA: phosphotransferase [Caldilineaceae bacterium]|nr:phosphotransferase [Caldilineaceae bacterium]
MTDLADLRVLLHHEYGLDQATLSPLHPVAQVGRGLYRVDLPGRGTWVLRAYPQERNALPQLASSAAVLHSLAQVNFPAPRVQRTVDDEFVGYHQGWSALLVTYIPGEPATGTIEEYRTLGTLIAQLHCLDLPTSPSGQTELPPCRWQPMQKVREWLSTLEHVQSQLPQELHGLYVFSVDILSQVLQWPTLPIALLHADPNHFNAIRTAAQELTLIDWDLAGYGPPILDLGYLLLTAHATLPAWPAVDANHVLIEAIMAGYWKVRPLTSEEGRGLPIATCFNDAVWAAQALPQVVGRNWRENRTLSRFGAR